MTGMQPVDGIVIPAGGTVTLEPGGYHVMLVGLTGDLAAGQVVRLTLTFKAAGAIERVRRGPRELTCRDIPARRAERRPRPRAEPRAIDRRAAAVGVVMLAFLALLAAGLVAIVVRGTRGATGGAARSTPGPASFAYAEVRPAPALELTDQDGNPFSLASLRGSRCMVFFGYTHCPDVCPATVGNVNQVLVTTGDGPRAVFVSIDPERDDVAAMNQYLRYLPKAYVGLSGTPADVRRNADAWGVKYARIDNGSAKGYAMAHTADVFLVDAQGMLRAALPVRDQGWPDRRRGQGAHGGGPGRDLGTGRHRDRGGERRPANRGAGDRGTGLAAPSGGIAPTRRPKLRTQLRPHAHSGNPSRPPPRRHPRARCRRPPSAGGLQQHLGRRRQPSHPDHHRRHGRRP